MARASGSLRPHHSRFRNAATPALNGMVLQPICIDPLVGCSAETL